MRKPKNLRKKWKTLTSSKHQKFNAKNWKNGESSWRKEIDSKLACPGIYCLHDGKRIFYIGESTVGKMRDRWDPNKESSHDFGRKQKKNGRRSGAKWSGQGKFSSGELRLTVENAVSHKVTSTPKLDYIPYKVIPEKSVRRKKRIIKKIAKCKDEQKAEIKFLEYFLIRKAAFVHSFGGLTPNVDVKKSEFNKIIASRDFVTKSTVLKNGWTLFNKKDGIPFAVKISKGTKPQQNNCTKIKQNYAKNFKIKKVICDGSRNPFTGDNGLLGNGSDFANLKDYEGNTKAKLRQTYDIRLSIKTRRTNQTSRITSNVMRSNKALGNKKSAPKNKAAAAEKAPAKKAINSKKKNLTKVQTLRIARRKKQTTWSWNGNRMGKVADYVITKGKRVAKR